LKITDTNVVQQLQQRNQKAISFVIKQYGGLIAAVVRRYIHDSYSEYEECLDDVLLAIWHNIESYDPDKKPFKHWVAAIAKYKAIDSLRKRAALQQKQLNVPEISDDMYRHMIELQIE